MWRCYHLLSLRAGYEPPFPDASCRDNIYYVTYILSLLPAALLTRARVILIASECHNEYVSFLEYRTYTRGHHGYSNLTRGRKAKLLQATWRRRLLSTKPIEQYVCSSNRYWSTRMKEQKTSSRHSTNLCWTTFHHIPCLWAVSKTPVKAERTPTSCQCPSPTPEQWPSHLSVAKLDVKNLQQKLDGAEVSYEMRDGVTGLLHVKCGKQDWIPYWNWKKFEDFIAMNTLDCKRLHSFESKYVFIMCVFQTSRISFYCVALLPSWNCLASQDHESHNRTVLSFPHHRTSSRQWCWVLLAKLGLLIL